MYNRLCIITYKNFFIELLYFKRDKITRKTRYFMMNCTSKRVIEDYAYNEKDIRIK